jgi:glutathione S-transferase
VAHHLFVIHGSHPCGTVERALELKGVPYRRVELPPAVHVPVQRLLFGGRTVPALRLEGGERVQGSRAIVRRLEQLAPEPALLPADPAARARVEEAESWGEETWQPIGRRLLWPALARSPRAITSYQEGSRLPRFPMRVALAIAPGLTAIERRLNDATDDRARDDLRALPGHLDRIDGWIGAGVIGGDQANAADLQIAATTRLLMTIEDVDRLMAGRPAREHALRHFPSWPGHVPAGALTEAVA